MPEREDLVGGAQDFTILFLGFYDSILRFYDASAQTRSGFGQEEAIRKIYLVGPTTRLRLF